MAITNLISGEVRNKVGGMVGAKWKGKNYVRAYVVPKNPKTESQMAVRGEFKKLSIIGSAINPYILKPYTAKVFKNLSPVNRFVKINSELIQAGVPDWTKFKIFDGGALAPSGLTATGVAATGTLTIGFTPAEQLVTPTEYKYCLVAANLTTGVTNYKVDTAVGGTAITGLSAILPMTTTDEVVVAVAVYTDTLVEGVSVLNNSGTIAVMATIS